MTAESIAKVRRSKTGFQAQRFAALAASRLAPGADRDGKPNAPHVKGANKMNMSEYFGSAFVKINDLANGPERKTIAKVEIGRYGRPVLTFTDRSRLSVNVTNNKVHVRAFGDDDEAWVGQKNEDGETDSVLVRPPPAATRKPQSDSDDSMSDGIPFN
jgi:hypothetical protein